MFSSYTDDEKWAMFDHMAVIVTNANSATYDAIESADLREFFRIFREVADAMRSGSLGEMALSAGTSSMAPAGAMEFGGLMSARMSLNIASTIVGLAHHRPGSQGEVSQRMQRVC